MTQSVRLRRSQLQTLLQQENLQGAKALLVPVQPADIAQAIEGLPEAMQAIAFRLLSKQEARDSGDGMGLLSPRQLGSGTFRGN